MRITKAATDFVKNFVTGVQGPDIGLAKTVGKEVFHFGVHPTHSVKMFVAYFIKMFPWLFFMSFFGVLIYALNFKKIKKKNKVFLY